MRVLHLLHSSLPNVSGYSVRSAQVLDYLRRHGVELRAVTSAQQPSPTAAVEMIEGVEVWRTRAGRALRLLGGVPVARELALMAVLARRAGEAAADFRPDLVHAHTPALCGWPGWRVARRLGVPLVYEVRDFWENASVDVGKFAYDSLRYRAACYLESALLRAAEAVVVLSAAQAEEVRRRGVPAARITLAANGVESKLALPEPDPELAGRLGVAGKPVILYLGALLPYEGLDLLLEAMPRIRAAEPEARLLVVGEGAIRGKLEAQAAGLGLGEAVRFVGQVPRDQVTAYYALAALAVYPRLRTRTTEITTPLKPLEAMVLGVPVLATDLPALRELVTPGETGLLANPGDAGDLAEKCLYALRHGEQMRRLAAAARRFACQERDWEATLAPYLELYGRLAAKSAAALAQ